MLIEAVQDIRSNDLTRIFADMLRAERRRKFNKLARSRNPFKGKPVYDNVALDQPEIDAVKKQFLPIAQQYSTEWRKTLSGPLKPKLTYGAPSDWFTLGMTLYDVFSGFLCQSRLSGPWPNKRAIASMGYDPDFSKPMNLRQWRQEVADLNGYSPDDEGIADLADLLTKMLHVDAASRLSDPLRILAHPFFAKMG
ncbi:hypothetical protein DFJ74DRAFT_695579 [Hyaloraphidium curvatum]|nr:hypothetical protein DFJ74DRAFT_695579 [Hyaloraphidium curvatum]